MNDRHAGSRVVRAPRGTQLACRSWLTEAAFRMIQNNLDPEVAENPAELVVYGGIGAGRWIFTAGLGGMGGAQPLAATMAGASMLAVECRQSRIDMRLRTKYLDRQAKDLDEALAIVRGAKMPTSVGLLANAAD